MAFGAISVLYLPLTANAGSSQWGTNVRKLLSAADTTTDTTTTTTHGTGGSVIRTDDPYTSQGSDLDQSLYGWAVTPADMNSVSGILRRYPAGNHVGTCRMVSNSGTAGNARVTMYAYRVGNAAGGRVRTLLGSVNSSIQSLGNTYLTFTATLALGEIIFGVDETIQYSFETTSAGVAGGRTVTFATGTEPATVGTAIRINTPTLAMAIQPAGFAPAIVFGTPTLSQKVLPSGFTPNVVFGTATLLREVNPTGFTPSVVFGTPTLSQEISPTGFTPTVTFGTPVLVQDQFIDVAGFTPIVDFGQPTLVELLAVGGFTPTVVFGDTTVILGNVLPVTGFTPTIIFGATTLATQPVITGTVFNHETGEPVGAGVVVKLFDDNDNLIDTTVTDGSGSYTFLRPIGDTDLYWTLAYYEILGVQYHGVSNRDCPAV